MAEVNTSIYPTEGQVEGVIKWSKTLTGANFSEYSGGLENSITFSSTAHPRAPFNNICTCFSTWDTDIADIKTVARYTSGYNNQRIFLTKSVSASQYTNRYPNPMYGTKQMREAPFDASFNNSTHQIITGIKWTGICGRMLVYFSITPVGDPLTEDGAHQVGSETFVTTWKNFKAVSDYLTEEGRTIFVWGVYISDIWGGNPSGSPTRDYAITPLSITPLLTTVFEDYDTGTEFAGLWYGAYGMGIPQPYPTQLVTNVNSVNTTFYGNIQGNTNSVPVFGLYASINARAGGQSTGSSGGTLEECGGYVVVGAIEGEAPQHLFEAYYQTTTAKWWGVAMAVTAANRAAFLLAMEERAATFGIIVLTNSPTPAPTWSTNLTNLAALQDAIIPLMDENGLYSGFTEDGEEALTNPKTAEIIAGGVDGVFEYGVPVDDPDTDPNHYVDSIDLSEPNLTAVDAFNRTFAMNKNGLDAFANFLWNANETKFDEIVKGLALFGENPIEGVINMLLFPFDVHAKAGGSLQEIKIGRTLTGVQGYRISERAPAVIDLGSAEFRAAFKDTAPFLDYEPYTQAELYIPFIGKIPISTAQFVGHKVSVKMIVDYLTGAAVAVVYCDNIPVIYKQGVIGVQIPITATNSAQFAETMIGGIIGTAKGIGDTAAKAATGNIGGALMSGAETALEAYQTAATPVMYESAGASSPSCAIYQPLKPYFVMYRPVPKEVNIYGHTVGYATQKTVQVGTCSGFSVFGNVDTTGIYGATDAERAEIKRLLETGVYL